MQLRLPPSLHYPITVTELLKKPNDNVERFEPLFDYFYKTPVTEGDDLGNERQLEKAFPARYESSVDGKLLRWKIQKGAVITHFKYGHHHFAVGSRAYLNSSVDIAEIDEPCDHSVQFGGMCANCGKDMTEYVLFQAERSLCRAMSNNQIQVKLRYTAARRIAGDHQHGS